MERVFEELIFLKHANWRPLSHRVPERWQRGLGRRICRYAATDALAGFLLDIEGKETGVGVGLGCQLAPYSGYMYAAITPDTPVLSTRARTVNTLRTMSITFVLPAVVLLAT